MLGGIEVFVFFSMSGRSGKGKEEGVAPSSSGLLETDQGGVFQILFFLLLLICHQWVQAVN